MAATTMSYDIAGNAFFTVDEATLARLQRNVTRWGNTSYTYPAPIPVKVESVSKTELDDIADEQELMSEQIAELSKTVEKQEKRFNKKIKTLEKEVKELRTKNDGLERDLLALQATLHQLRGMVIPMFSDVSILKRRMTAVEQKTGHVVVFI